MAQSMENLCRICVGYDGHMVSIFSTLIDSGGSGNVENDKSAAARGGRSTGETIAQVMVSCLGADIEQDDNLPQHICGDCFQKLKASWDLRATAKWSEKHLRQMLQSTEFKNEPEQFKEEEVEFVEGIEEDYVDEEVLEETVLVEELSIPSNQRDPLHSEFGWHFFDLKKGFYKIRKGEDPGWNLIEISGTRCCGCFTSFPTKVLLEEHCKVHHREEQNAVQTRSNECMACQKAFPSMEALSFHQKIARSRQLFHCTVCQLLSPSKRQLKAHLKLHTESELLSVSPVVMEEPPEKSTGQKNVQQPPPAGKCRSVKTFLTFDYITFDGFCCCECWCYCETKREMKRHGEKEHYNNRGFEEDMVCFGCLRSFTTKESFDKHMAELNTKHVYWCKTCELMFRSSELLQKHQQTSEDHDGFVELEMLDVKEEVEVEEEVVPVPLQVTKHVELEEVKHVSMLKENPNKTVVNTRLQILKDPHEKQLYAPQIKRNDPDLSEITVVDIYNQDTVRCCGCYQTFSTEAEVVKHCNKQHRQFQVSDDKDRPYECQRCYRRFVKAVSLQIHQYFVRNVLTYACKLCNEQFTFHTPFLLHYIQHENQSWRYKEDKRGAKPKVTENDARFFCCFNFCTQSFDEYSELLGHVDDNHGVKRNQFKHYRDSDENCCEICFRSFGNYRALLRHVTQRKKGRPAHRHTCSSCGMQFKSLALLKDHENKHLGIKPYECELCSKTFGSKAILKNHMTVHQDSRPFSCEFCGKTFARKRNYKDHSMTHTDEKPWECEICKLTFRIESQFLTHKRRHTGVRPYKCSFCEKVFSHATDRKRHEMAAHTGEKPHQCSFCPLAFIRRRQLVIHERTHTGEKPFECQHCGQAFIQQSYLTRHLATHK
ncbi:zinc finger protein 420-like [Sabethes cyaneus]|uniref:zinc finger protein 420-like n=1 Tax=Sabethes cyaneus TaxID=53552 RepID=UPI00237DA352|nr:zinc finger protein 420-like [Sabethes cyaneus]